MNIELTPKDKDRYKVWLKEAISAATFYDGTERAEKELFESLRLMDEFARTINNGKTSDKFEHDIAEHIGDEARSVGDILNLAQNFYDRTKQQTPSTFLQTLREAKKGAVIHDTKHVFVQTDSGEILAGGESENRFGINSAPRLAILVEHLREIGVYTDDLIIHVGQVAQNMVRKHPYILIQIPRLNREIAICDRIGEITFVGHQIHDPLVWSSFTKDQLKAREDISCVIFNNEEQWWNELQMQLETDQSVQKINVKSYDRKRPPLDPELIKETIRVHHQETGKWPTQTSDDVLYGPYAGQERWRNIHASLSQGNRGLPGGSSLAKFMEEMNEGYIHPKKKEPWDIEKIKECARLHHQERGEWPNGNSGDVLYGAYAKQERWGNIDAALSQGTRGLPGGSSLAKVMEEMGEGYVSRLGKEPWDIEKIKECIRLHHQETGEWPNQTSGHVLYGAYAKQERWGNIDAALSQGTRGLPGGSSLAKVMEEMDEGYIHPKKKEPLNIEKIKECIRLHHQATGEWPTRTSGDVLYGAYTDQEKWKTIDSAIHSGTRGLPGGSSLAQVMEEMNEGYIHPKKKEPWDIEKIKECIRLHHQATGEWPTQKSGDVLYGAYAGQEKWGAINAALSTGTRGLPGGSSLAQVMEEMGEGYVSRLGKEPWDIEKIKECIRMHRKETGEWPKVGSGTVLCGPYAHQEKWHTIDSALRSGTRGLPDGSSLATFMEEMDEGYIHPKKKEPWDIEKIKECIRMHHQETGEWPTQKSGDVLYGAYAGQESWGAINAALGCGTRGLPGGSSLAQVMGEMDEGYIHPKKKKPWDIEKIKECIRLHHQETGEWPTQTSGDVLYGAYAGQERWANINAGLRSGTRGLPGGSSLAQIMEEMGEGYRNHLNQEPFDIEKIKECIRLHHQEIGEWPTQTSGDVLYGAYAGQVCWGRIDCVLRSGGRGLPGGSSLFQIKREMEAVMAANDHQMEPK